MIGLLATFLIMIPLGFSYNSTYDNITLEVSGWCAGIPVKFRILNASEVALYPDLEDEEYHPLSSFPITIHDGPFDSSPVLAQTETDASGYFTYTFPEPKQYLIEIGSKGNFNELSQIVPIEDCDIKISKYNLTFINNGTITLIKNSNINFKESPINFTKVSVSGPSILAYIIMFKQDFTYDDLIIGFQKPNGYANFKVIYRTDKDTPVEILNSPNISFTTAILSNYILFRFSKDKQGIYILRGDKIDISLSNSTSNSTVQTKSNKSLENESNMTESKNVSSSSREDAKLNNKEESKNSSSVIASTEEPDNSNSSRWQVLFIRYFLISLLVIIIIAAVSSKKKFKSSLGNSKKKGGAITDKNNEKSSDNNPLENEIREYIRKYRDSYSKDQIFRALKKAGVDIETISRLLDEEY